MTNNQPDIESLISSTLDAIDIAEKSVPGSSSRSKPESESVGEGAQVSGVDATDTDVDVLLSRLEQAAPKLRETSTASPKDHEDLEHLFGDLLTPASIVDSMESLASELETFLKDKDATGGDNQRYHKQLQIYKEVSVAYKLNENILDEKSAEGDRIRSRLAELQTLGNPPPEVVEKLMLSQLPTDEGNGDIAKEFQSFLKEAGEGGLLPGLTKEDEDMLRKLTQDPNALKNLLGGDKTGAPDECSVM